MRWQLDRVDIFERDEWTCQVCGNSLTAGTPQLAHRIGQRKMFLKMYGKEIIHHPTNLVSVCSLECNAKVDISNRPEEVKKLVEEIKLSANNC
jgi:5-methylcytosine-specific restriction endonuclease McrA